MVGEVAKKLGITVKTLHHYDKLKLVRPSGESEGGRRLYSDKDIYKIHQVLSLKKLGFSLEEIKQKLKPLDKPSDVVAELEIQYNQIIKKIESFTKVKDLIFRLIKDMKGVEEINWKKLAILATVLSEQESFYWAASHFSDKLLIHTATRFDDKSAEAFNIKQDILNKKIYELIGKGISEKADEAQVLIKEWWDMVQDFTDGDMSLVLELKKFHDTRNEWSNKEFVELWNKTDAFIQNGLEYYFTINNMEVNI